MPIWIQTHSGQEIDLEKPHFDTSIEDIAHALSNTCRYNGHSIKFYSVAEHCYWASKICAPEIALECLLHDAGEAYLGDVIYPIKQELVMERMFEQKQEGEVPVSLQEFETSILEIIFHNFDLQFPCPSGVHEADMTMLATEMMQVAPHIDTKHMPRRLRPAKISLRCWGPAIAKHQFLERYEELLSADL